EDSGDSPGAEEDGSALGNWRDAEDDTQRARANPETGRRRRSRLHLVPGGDRARREGPLLPRTGERRRGTGRGVGGPAHPHRRHPGARQRPRNARRRQAGRL
ncbi:MAG: Transcriptional regulator, Xre family, partial [uncultured Rubrobacteraceae bacterium]